ncbi:MAG: exodeoxyribonuclease VII small subunit [Deltaproteobacteria bacterium]|nr:MAG: exodeoxyribonuclease VII small subunit [Deltaproteobacteria bacterium]
MSTTSADEETSWAAAVDELEDILRAIEDEQLDIDSLGPQVERAATLIRTCRSILDETGIRVREALVSLEPEQGEPEQGDA